MGRERSLSLRPFSLSTLFLSSSFPTQDMSDDGRFFIPFSRCPCPCSLVSRYTHGSFCLLGGGRVSLLSSFCHLTFSLLPSVSLLRCVPYVSPDATFDLSPRRRRCYCSPSPSVSLVSLVSASSSKSWSPLLSNIF